MALFTWKNTAENLGISILAFIAGAFVCYVVMGRTVESTASMILEANNKVITEALKRETTSIKNEFKTEIKKLKTKKGEVEFDVKPIIENHIDQDETNTNINPDKNQNQKSNDSLKKRSFFGRLLSGKKYKTKKN